MEASHTNSDLYRRLRRATEVAEKFKSKYLLYRTRSECGTSAEEALKLRHTESSQRDVALLTAVTALERLFDSFEANPNPPSSLNMAPL
jgi:hypothetical protein